jgi:formylmethanofuran dehydrogenase subunit C
MTGWTLHMRQQPALRLDMRGLTPRSLGALTQAEVERTLVGHGNRLQPLAEFFTVSARRRDETLVYEGDLARCDRVGWQMDGGRLIVDGAAGDYAGACMSEGEITVWGDAGALAGCEMAGGTLNIEGNAGEFAASTLPGSMDGMRGGSLVVRGSAGARLGDRMRRGTVVVFGNVGDFVASRLVAGTIAVGGQPGAHGGYAMRRGSVVFATAAPEPSPTFVPAIAAVPVFWQLLARDLARHGGPFASLPARAIDRHLGDLAADGKGEWIVVR